jgi:integrase
MKPRRPRGKHAAATETKRLHLTDRRIEALPTPVKTTSVYDAKTPALGLRLMPTGRRTFFWWRAVAGKPKWVTVGEWPDVKLEGPNGARAKAEELNVRLNNWKKDGCRPPNPFEKPADDGVLTLERLAELYIERQVLPHAAHPERAAKKLRDTLTRYLPDWKSKELSEIRRSDVLTRHARLGRGVGLTRKKRHGNESGRTTANHTVDTVRTLYNWAIDNELWTGTNPARLRKKQRFAEPARNRCLGPEELVRLLAACAASKNPDLADFVQLSLATGQRKKTVMRARWDAIDIANQTWRLAASETKNRRDFTIELSPAAVRVLRGRLAKRAANTAWVFPGIDPARPRFDFNQGAWRKLLKEARLDYPRSSPLNFRGHDLRHTYVSYGVMAGRSLEQVGAAVGHLSPASTRRYAHLAQAVQRETVLAGELEMQKRIAAAQKRLACPEKIPDFRG